MQSMPGMQWAVVLGLHYMMCLQGSERWRLGGGELEREEDLLTHRKPAVVSAES